MSKSQTSAVAFLGVWTAAFALAALMNTSPGFVPVPHADKAWSFYWAAVALGSLLAAVISYRDA